MFSKKLIKTISAVCAVSMIITSAQLFSVGISAAEKYLEAGESVSLDVGAKWLNHAQNWDTSVNGQKIDSVPGGNHLHFAGNSTRTGCGVTLDLGGLTENTSYTITCDIDLATGEHSGVKMSTDCGSSVWVGSSKTATIMSNVNIGNKTSVRVTIKTETGTVTPAYDITKITVYQGTSTTPYKVYDFENNVPTINNVHGAWCGTPRAEVKEEKAHISVTETVSGNNNWAVNQRAVYCELSEPLTLEAGEYKFSCEIRPNSGNSNGKRGFGIALASSIKPNGNANYIVEAIGGGIGSYVQMNVGEWNRYERTFVFDDTVTLTHVSIRGGTDGVYDGGAYGIRNLKLENTSPAEIMHGSELVPDGGCDSGIPAGLQKGTSWSNANISYNSALKLVTVSDVSTGSDNFKYVTSVTGGVDESLPYVLSMDIRQSDPGAKSKLRIASPFGGKAPIAEGDSDSQIEINGEWQTFSFIVSADSNTSMFSDGQIGIYFQGYNLDDDGYEVGFRELQIDNISLICLASENGGDNLIPGGAFDNEVPEENLNGWYETDSGCVVKSRIIDGTGVIMLDSRTDKDSLAVYESDLRLSMSKAYNLFITLRSRNKNGDDSVCLYTINKDGERIPVVVADADENAANVVTASGEWVTYTVRIDPEDNNKAFYENESFVIAFGADEDGFGTVYIDEIRLIEDDKYDDGIPARGIIMMILYLKDMADGVRDNKQQQSSNKPSLVGGKCLHFSGDDDGGAGLIDIDLGAVTGGQVRVTCTMRVTDEYEKQNTLTRTDVNKGRLRVQYKLGDGSYTGCVSDNAGAAADWLIPIEGQAVTVVETNTANANDTLKLSIYGDTEHTPAFDIMNITVYVNGEIVRVFDFTSPDTTPKYSIKWGRGTASIIDY